METRLSRFWLGVQDLVIRIILFFLKPFAFVWKILEPKNISGGKLSFLVFSLYFVIWFSYPAFLILNHNGEYWSYSYTTFWSTILVFIIQLVLCLLVFVRIKTSAFKGFELGESHSFVIGLTIFASVIFSICSIFSFGFGTYKNDYEKIFTENKCEQLYSSEYENHVKRCKKVKTEALNLIGKTFEIDQVNRIENTTSCTARLAYKPEKEPIFSYELEKDIKLCDLSKSRFNLVSVNIYYHSNSRCVAKANQVTKYTGELYGEPSNMYTCYVFEKVN